MTETPEAPAQTDTSAADICTVVAYKRLTPAQMHLILALYAEQKPQIDIAALVGVHVSTVSRFLKQIGDPHKVVQQIMQGDSLQALTDWKRARRQAAKRGDHRPAREWLEAAHPEMRPVTAATAGGGGVTINIGIAGQPVRVPTIDITPAPSLSPLVIEATGETTQNQA